MSPATLCLVGALVGLLGGARRSPTATSRVDRDGLGVAHLGRGLGVADLLPVGLLTLGDHPVHLNQGLAEADLPQFDLGGELECQRCRSGAGLVLPLLALVRRDGRGQACHRDALLEGHLLRKRDDEREVVHHGVRHDADGGVGFDRRLDQAGGPVDDALELLRVELLGGTAEVFGVGQGEAPSDIGF